MSEKPDLREGGGAGDDRLGSEITKAHTPPCFLLSLTSSRHLAVVVVFERAGVRGRFHRGLASGIQAEYLGLVLEQGEK